MLIEELKTWLQAQIKDMEFAADYDSEESMGNYDDVFRDGVEKGFYEAYVKTLGMLK